MPRLGGLGWLRQCKSLAHNRDKKATRLQSQRVLDAVGDVVA